MHMKTYIIPKENKTALKAVAINKTRSILWCLYHKLVNLPVYQKHELQSQV